MENNEEKKTETERIKVGGITVTIWHNENWSESISISRSYKNKDGKFATSQYLRVNDIPKTILGLQKAYERLMLRRG